MKKYFLAVILITFLAKGVYSQAPLDAAFLKSDKEQMTNIDKIVDDIKANLKNYTKTEEIKDSINQRCSYKKNSELALITVYFKDQHVAKNVEWYFHKGDLIYTQKVWTDANTKQIIQNEKGYLNKDHLFCWLKFDKPVDPNSPDFKTMESNLAAYALNLESEYRK